LPFTDTADAVLRITLEVALEWGHNYIGTEHMLLALLEQGEGTGYEVLDGLGVKKDKAEAKILEVLAEILAARGQ
jgi:ATP-dependent Clp protease ATP-binding subunit ClpA